MSLPNELLPVGLLGTGAAGGGYQIQRSLRFNSSDSAYLSRTPASAGNRKTWTWAGWVKRTAPGTGNYLFMCQPDASNYSEIYFDTDDKLKISNRVGGTDVSRRFTTAVYRDVSAWYHIVVASNSSSLLKVYVNGLEVTEFSTSTGPTTADWSFNSTSAHGIGANSAGTGYFLNGFLADIHFIDGQALGPTSFGEFDTNGIWQPIEYIGTYGTNGFHLPFSDNSTASALGTDTSGNGNTWTVNNISVAAGAGNDSLVDSPTSYGIDDGLGGSVRGNYATLNPLSKGASTTLSNGNLDYLSSGATSTTNSAASTLGVESGKWYWEVTLTSSSADILGAVAKTAPTGDGFDPNIIGLYFANGDLYNQGSSSSYGLSFATNDVLGIALDVDAGKIWFSKNGSWMGSGSPNPATGTSAAVSSGIAGFRWFADVGHGGAPVTRSCSLNFGQRPFAYTAPSGFKALCTTNLPTPTIADGSTAMDVVTYTGNGSTQTISGLGFSPDLVWIKSRNIAYFHRLNDSVRGAQKFLYSNATNAEATSTLNDRFVSFDSTGFTLGIGDTPSADGLNQNTLPYVAWTWDAGSSTVTNTDGSITSQVRANPSAGFSIVTFTGTGSNGTVGHGLGVAPELVIVKFRNNAGDWATWHKGISSADYLRLNSTAASTNSPSIWNSTSPGSSVFTVGVSLSASGYTCVAYCFAPVAGYSAFGSYTGNGSSTDGPFIALSFRPRWIMLKNTSAIGDWFIYDAARLGYNVNNELLKANTSEAEIAGTAAPLDLLSNGVKIRMTTGNTNANGNTYIYAAFAEHPFSLARAR